MGIPNAANEGAQFDLDATYNVSIATNYIVGDLNAYGGNATMAFQIQPITSPTLIYTTGGLTVTPSTTSSTSLTSQDGNITVTGNTVIGSSTGTAQLVLADAVLANSFTTLASTAGSSGNLTLNAFSSWTSTQSVVIGGSGAGELDMAAGSRSGIFGGDFVAQSSATTAGATLGQSIGGTGTANIRGNWNTGDLTVGSAGAATINLQGTAITTPIPLSSVGHLTSANASIAAQPGSSGNVNVTAFVLNGLNPLGSAWTVTGSLAIGGTTTTAGGTGTLAIGFANSVTVGADMKIWSGGGIQLTQGGTLSITGAANLGGNLSFNLINTPHAGDSFSVLSATGGVTGTFASTTLPTLSGGLSWNVVYTPTAVSLAIAAGVPGDFNANGIVDAADYVIWRNDAGTTTALANDSIGGTIGSGQYNEWRSHFGQTSGSGASADLVSAVPEPAGTSLVTFVVIFVLARRRLV